jgi:D-alanyl-D-alanine carboxypeptidase
MVGRLAALAVLLGATAAMQVGCGGSSPQREPADARSGTPATAAQGGFDPRLAARLQETLDRVREHQGMPGAAAAVVLPGAGVWTGASGVADRESARPVTDRTMFAVGSVTKPFTAALMLKLAERGVIDLDDRLSRWVPDFPESRRIRLRQLLDHTAGTVNFTDDERFWKAQTRRPDATWTPRMTLRYARGEPAFAPGETWGYSNTNYVLAGLVIRRATRATAADALHRLLDRRRFPRIVLQGEERPRGAVAVGYQDIDEDPELEATPNNGHVPSTSEATAAWTAGGMLASAGDLARAGHGLLSGDLLAPESRRQMTRFAPTYVRHTPEYGLGLVRDELGGEQVWSHGGDIFGFHADLAHVPELDATVAAVANYQQQTPGQNSLIDALISDVSEHADG